MLLDLALRANIPIEVHHNHTTADAPETVYFIRQQMYELECDGITAHIDYPVYRGQRTSLWKLMREEMFPPLRTVRYCCRILKETAGIGRMIATGVRWGESVRRAKNRGIYENNTTNVKSKVVLTSDDNETRRIFEQCNIRGGMVCNPIVDWTDKEIWDYINAKKLPVNPMYRCGFNRIGCIGCPMANRKRWEHFARYPKYKDLYISAFEDIVCRRRAAGKDCTGAFRSGQALFDWWMQDKNLDGQLSLENWGKAGNPKP